MESRSVQTNPLTSLHPEPRIYTRSEHPVSRKYISENALKVLYRLDKAGFKAFLVGGSVRDLLLGREPKDFDVATDALPEQVRELFRNCRLIGRRFRLAHVQFGQEIIEVATFRAAHDGDAEGAATSDEGRILRDNVYGDIDDDVWRRDFTVNALYYNIADFSIVDYVGGYEDIKVGRLRLLGDPETRYREDPVRMLRAVRFAVKLGFVFDPATAAPFVKLGHLLEEISPARLFDEVLKLFHGGVAHQTYEVLRRYGLFARLFPLAEATLAREENNFPHMLIAYALQSTDARIADDKPVTPAFLFAALLWHAVEAQTNVLVADGMEPNDAFMFAADTVISKQVARIAIPRRFTNVTREIWGLQQRLVTFSPKRAARLAEHPRFRAGYDFLLLRAQAGEAVGQAAEFWMRYLEVPENERGALVASLEGSAGEQSRRRRRRRRPRKSASE